MGTEIVFLKKPKLKNAVLFTGLPGVGLVGKIAVDYLLKEFNAEKIAEIYSDSFPPSAHTVEGIIELISDALYLYEFNGRHFLFLAGPVQPSLNLAFGTGKEHYEFASKIVEVCEKLKVKEIYTLAGINVGDKRMEEEPEIIAAVTDNKLVKEWKGVKVNKKGGLISGAAGLIPGLAREKGIKGACLMGETNARLIYGDHGAAKKLIELLVKKYGFKVDMKGIKKEAKHIEEAFSQLSKQLEERREDEHPPKTGLSYVR